LVASRNREDRLYVPGEKVVLFIEKEWKSEGMMDALRGRQQERRMR
jgi:hypothetical protein